MSCFQKQDGKWPPPKKKNKNNNNNYTTSGKIQIHIYKHILLLITRNCKGAPQQENCIPELHSELGMVFKRENKIINYKHYF